MKTASLKISAALAASLFATDASADSLSELQRDIDTFKDSYLQRLEEAGKSEGVIDRLKLSSVTSAIRLGCGGLSEAVQSKNEFLEDCLDTIASSQTPNAGNVVGGYDKAEFDNLRRRLAALSVPHNQTPPKTGSAAELFNMPGFKQETSAETILNDTINNINVACPGSFQSFENITSPQCVAATTYSMKEIAAHYSNELPSISYDFNSSCNTNLSVEITGPIDPHGTWYNEYMDITRCFNQMQGEARNTGVKPSEKIYAANALVLTMIQAYENAYETKYPYEGWESPHPKDIGQSLDMMFGR